MKFLLLLPCAMIPFANIPVVELGGGHTRRGARKIHFHCLSILWLFKEERERTRTSSCILHHCTLLFWLSYTLVCLSLVGELGGETHPYPTSHMSFLAIPNPHAHTSHHVTHSPCLICFLSSPLPLVYFRLPGKSNTS